MANGNAPETDHKHSALEGSACMSSAQPEGAYREIVDAVRPVDSPVQPSCTAESSELPGEGEAISPIDTDDGQSRRAEVERLVEPASPPLAAHHPTDRDPHEVSSVEEADTHAEAQEGRDATLDLQETQDAKTAAAMADSQLVLPKMYEEAVVGTKGPER